MTSSNTPTDSRGADAPRSVGGGSHPAVGILASGRGSNAEALIRAVSDGRLRARIAVVLSDNPEAGVLAHARAAGIEALHIDPGRPGARIAAAQEQAYVDALLARGVAWVALAGFMRILGPTLLAGYPGRILNIHPSLLPAFPGLHAQRQALEHGVKLAGCTVHFVDAGVDTGPIVAQAAVPVLDHDTEESLSARILEQEHRVYADALDAVLSGTARREGRRVFGIAGGIQ